MAARRCSTCGINYPPALAYEKCQGCDGRTDWISNIEVHDDWEDRLVGVQKSVSAMPEVETRHATNRLDRFRSAGLSLDLALLYAGNAAVDLHLFERLIFEGCPAQVAARIVAPLDS